MNAQALTAVARVADRPTIRLLTIVCSVEKKLLPDDRSRPTAPTKF
jgi:hypothetical protein